MVNKVWSRYVHFSQSVQLWDDVWSSEAQTEQKWNDIVLPMDRLVRTLSSPSKQTEQTRTFRHNKQLHINVSWSRYKKKFARGTYESQIYPK